MPKHYLTRLHFVTKSVYTRSLIVYRNDKTAAPNTLTQRQPTKPRAARFGEGNETHGGCADAPFGVEIKPETTILAAEITGVDEGFEPFGRHWIITGTGCGGKEDRRDRWRDRIGIAASASLSLVIYRGKGGPAQTCSSILPKRHHARAIRRLGFVKENRPPVEGVLPAREDEIGFHVIDKTDRAPAKRTQNFQQ